MEKGVLPIDSFLIFNSGYFVLNGLISFQRFWTVTGPLLDYSNQYFLIFLMFWTSYVIHSSLMNFSLQYLLFILYKS